MVRRRHRRHDAVPRTLPPPLEGDAAVVGARVVVGEGDARAQRAQSGERAQHGGAQLAEAHPSSGGRRVDAVVERHLHDLGTVGGEVHDHIVERLVSHPGGVHSLDRAGAVEAVAARHVVDVEGQRRSEKPVGGGTDHAPAERRPVPTAWRVAGRDHQISVACRPHRQDERQFTDEVVVECEDRSTVRLLEAGGQRVAVTLTSNLEALVRDAMAGEELGDVLQQRRRRGPVSVVVADERDQDGELDVRRSHRGYLLPSGRRVLAWGRAGDDRSTQPVSHGVRRKMFPPRRLRIHAAGRALEAGGSLARPHRGRRTAPSGVQRDER